MQLQEMTTAKLYCLCWKKATNTKLCLDTFAICLLSTPSRIRQATPNWRSLNNEALFLKLLFCIPFWQKPAGSLTLILLLALSKAAVQMLLFYVVEEEAR